MVKANGVLHDMVHRVNQEVFGPPVSWQTTREVVVRPFSIRHFCLAVGHKKSLRRTAGCESVHHWGDPV